MGRKSPLSAKRTNRKLKAKSLKLKALEKLEALETLEALEVLEPLEILEKQEL